jgi:hypothetical protein
MIAFSSISIFQVRLPPVNNQTPLIVYIRDTFDSITEYNLSSVSVVPDLVEINNLTVQLLTILNQNTINQMITSFSQVFNNNNSQNIINAVSSKLDFILNR